jgi:hypothetical protein
MSVHEKELFFKSMEKWGYASQILMLAEECGELSVVCLHSLRARKEKKDTIGKSLEDFK